MLKYRSDIDGLRAVAVIAVLGFHAFPEQAKGGFIGVDIFFVISGYLISSIIFAEVEAGKFSLRSFYSRRIQRIFPALLLVLISTLLFGWFTLFQHEYKQLSAHAAGGIGFVANLLLWNETGYFDNASELKPLLHLWSLGIEEQFYIFWPVLIGLGWKFRCNFLTVTIFITVGSFFLNLYTLKYGTLDSAFYLPQNRVWE
jgi:peptidoglycan/LPS O-acetylase OafA/YrhL